MSIPKIIYCMGSIDDGLISEAAAFEPKNKRFPVKWIAVAACICLLCFGVCNLKRVFNQEGCQFFPPDDPLTEPGYKVVYVDYPVFASSEDRKASTLYYLTKPADEKIEQYINESNVNVKPENGLYVFKNPADDDNLNYLFPTVDDGKIYVMNYIGMSQGKTGWGFSYRDFDTQIIEALSEYTSPETPLILISYRGRMFYVVGDTAYTDSINTNGVKEIPRFSFTDPTVQVRVIDLH